jgi:hypothetical protein
MAAVTAVALALAASLVDWELATEMAVAEEGPGHACMRSDQIMSAQIGLQTGCKS